MARRLSDRVVILLAAGLVVAVLGVYFLNPFRVESLDPRMRLFGVTFFRMPSRSMEPTIAADSIFLVSAWPYVFHPPARGDVLAFRYPPKPAVAYVKRLIARAGDTVAIVDCVAVVNGRPVDEPYLAPVADPRSDLCARQAIVVPQEQLYVLGDSRENSFDSRSWGFVPAGNVIGRVLGR